MGDLLGLLAWAPKGWGTQILEGTGMTVALALATLPLGMTIGLVVALGKNSANPWLVGLSNIYTTIFRGLPELLTLLIIYFGMPILIQAIIHQVRVLAASTASLIWTLSPERLAALSAEGEAFQINSFFAGMIALGVVFSAYSSEVMLGALRAVTRGQIEAARALGMSRGLTLRLVVLPQLLRYALPGLSNLWLVLLKDTSLVSVIGLSDLLRNINVAVGVTKQHLFFFAVACLIYLILAIISSIGIGWIETWSERGLRRAQT